MSVDPYALEADNVRRKFSYEAAQRMFAVAFYEEVRRYAEDERLRHAHAMLQFQQQYGHLAPLHIPGLSR